MSRQIFHIQKTVSYTYCGRQYLSGYAFPPRRTLRYYATHREDRKWCPLCSAAAEEVLIARQLALDLGPDRK
jgi:hypothetical protein